jgi:RNA polymerase sigma-70 factor (ECF subfamily)
VLSDESQLPSSRIAEVVHTHARLLYRVAYGIVRNAAAEDVCQDAVLQLLKAPEQVRNWQQIRAWLVRTVTNGALLHLRRKKVEAAAVQVMRPAEPVTPEADDFLLREKLLDRIEQLDPEIRQVVVLRVMQGLSGVEVQEILGLSASDVSRRLHAGLHRLRRAMVW